MTTENTAQATAEAVDAAAAAAAKAAEKEYNPSAAEVLAWAAVAGFTVGFAAKLVVNVFSSTTTTTSS